MYIAIAILFQASIGSTDLIICDYTLPQQDPTNITKQHKCMFSNYFITRATDKSNRPIAQFALMLQNAIVDNVTLFRTLKLITLHFKETSLSTNKSETQKQYTNQGCTNCLVASIQVSYTYYINTKRIYQQSNPTTKVRVLASIESIQDQRYVGYENLREIIKAA